MDEHGAVEIAMASDPDRLLKHVLGCMALLGRIGWTRLTLALALSGTALSCAPDPGCVTAALAVLPTGPPPPFIEGEITWVRSRATPAGNAVVQFMIESDETDRPVARASSPKAEVGVTCETRVLELAAHGGYRTVGATAVQHGRRARVWMDSRYPILDSDPPMISGGTVLLTDRPDP
jgi:hypothetical protein